uniref:Uncharacterized protein n=1 Tax=Arundo donax TaxID=35708 RepID=A0A0A9HS16_ARUDO
MGDIKLVVTCLYSLGSPT